MDIISAQVAPLARNLVDQVLGKEESEIKKFSQQTNQLKENLLLFDKHFKLRNYLVGYKLTLADVYLVACLIAPFQLLLDKKLRDQSLPNLTRYMTLNLHIQHFQKSFGVMTFCTKQISPNFDLKIEKHKEEKK